MALPAGANSNSPFTSSSSAKRAAEGLVVVTSLIC